jgi:hypothetical protein
VSRHKYGPFPLKFSNPKFTGEPIVTVEFENDDVFLIVRYRVETKSIYGKPDLAKNEYPYEFDVVEFFVTTSSTGLPYYEFEVDAYNHGLQVNVIEPRREYHFGVKDAFSHFAKSFGNQWEAEIKIPHSTIGWDGKQPLVGNAYAILGRPERRTHWSLFELPGGKPDFHVPSSFKPLFK